MKTIQEIEKEFDEKLKHFRLGIKSEEISEQEIKQFVRTQITEILEGLRMEEKNTTITCNVKHEDGRYEIECTCYDAGWDKAVSEHNALLDKIIGKV